MAEKTCAIVKRHRGAHTNWLELRYGEFGTGRVITGVLVHIDGQPITERFDAFSLLREFAQVNELSCATQRYSDIREYPTNSHQ